MISEGSCDTKDRSNNADSTALSSHGKKYILKYIKIENSYYIVIMFKKMQFFCIFAQVNAGLVSIIRDLFQNHKK